MFFFIYIFCDMWVSEGGVGGCYCCDRCNSSLNLEQNNYFLLEKREEAFRCAFEDNWILKLFDYVHIDWQQRERASELCNYEIMMMKTRQAFFFLWVLRETLVAMRLSFIFKISSANLINDWKDLRTRSVLFLLFYAHLISTHRLAGFFFLSTFWLLR